METAAAREQDGAQMTARVKGSPLTHQRIFPHIQTPAQLDAFLTSSFKGTRTQNHTQQGGGSNQAPLDTTTETGQEPDSQSPPYGERRRGIDYKAVGAYLAQARGDRGLEDVVKQANHSLAGQGLLRITPSYLEDIEGGLKLSHPDYTPSIETGYGLLAGDLMHRYGYLRIDETPPTGHESAYVTMEEAVKLKGVNQSSLHGAVTSGKIRVLYPPSPGLRRTRPRMLLLRADVEAYHPRRYPRKKR